MLIISLLFGTSQATATLVSTPKRRTHNSCHRNVTIIFFRLIDKFKMVQRHSSMPSLPASHTSPARTLPFLDHRRPTYERNLPAKYKIPFTFRLFIFFPASVCVCVRHFAPMPCLSCFIVVDTKHTNPFTRTHSAIRIYCIIRIPKNYNKFSCYKLLTIIL